MSGSQQQDRHKGVRTFQSGASKRKLAKAKKERESHTLSKMSKMTDFMGSSFKSSSIGTSSEHEKTLEEPPHLPTDMPDTDSVSEDSEEDMHVPPVPEVSGSKKDTENADLPSVPSQPANEIQNDIGKWPQQLSKASIKYWISKGPADLQHCDKETLEQNSARQQSGIVTRKCTPGMFERCNQNKETVHRTWLCFSPSTGKVYCFACRLRNAAKTSLTFHGFTDWKHASTKLAEHETSQDHIRCIVELAKMTKGVGRIDHDLEQQALDEEHYWHRLLQRLVSVIKFICERGLALHGDNENIGSPHNGNYLGILELLAEYDDFLKEHLRKFGGQGSGHASYLSSTICNELIEVMGDKVLSEIIARIKKSKYYSISLDSTPDESHTDQLTLIFRYMEQTEPVERFVTFMPNQGHKAQEMFNGLQDFLKEHNIDINNCRGQSYDNASAMSGMYNGLQAKVAAENELAYWIPCMGHSLNLVGQAAAECCPAAVMFFDFLEKLYTFFTSSTHRYEILNDALQSLKSEQSHQSQPPTVPKRVTTTRWSCRADATKALANGYSAFTDALQNIAEDKQEAAKTRAESKGLLDKMLKLETGIYCVFWNEILNRFSGTSQTLQSATLDLNNAVAAIQSLKAFVEERRNAFNKYEAEGTKLSGCTTYSQSYSRQRKRNVRLNPLDYGHGAEAEMSPAQKFKVESFLPVMDKLIICLNQRLQAYDKVTDLFGFLHRLDTADSDLIEEATKKLVQVYPGDLESCLSIELIQFAEFIKVFLDNAALEGTASKELLFYKLLWEKDVHCTFPNVENIILFGSNDQ